MARGGIPVLIDERGNEVPQHGTAAGAALVALADTPLDVAIRDLLSALLLEMRAVRIGIEAQLNEGRVTDHYDLIEMAQSVRDDPTEEE